MFNSFDTTTVTSVFKLKPVFEQFSFNLNWQELHKNPNAVDLLEEYFEHLDWNLLSGNKGAGKLLAKCPDSSLLCWKKLSANYSAWEYGLFEKPYVIRKKIHPHNLMRNTHPKVVEYIKKNFGNPKCNIRLDMISCNPSDEILEFLESIFYVTDIVQFGGLSSNTNPRALQMLEENLEFVSWQLLSANPSPVAVRILKNNEDKIDWYWASKNTNPDMCELFERNINRIDWMVISSNEGAIKFIEKYIRYVHWPSLSENSGAIHILEKNLDKVDFNMLSRNPAIFEERKYIEV